jgi:hypothetical protein
MAAPVHCLWDEEEHRERNLWDLGFDYIPLADPDITNPEDPFEDDMRNHFSTRKIDDLLGNTLAVQSNQPRDEQNSCHTHPVFAPSALTNTSLEARLIARDVGQDMTTSLKERVQAMAEADPRHISPQEKRRDAFIEIRLQQLDAEDLGPADVTVPNLLRQPVVDNTFQTPSHSENQHGNSNSAMSRRTSPMLCPTAVNTKIDEAHASTGPDFGVFRFGPGSATASGIGKLEAEVSENVNVGTKRQREEQPVQWFAGNESSRKPDFTEMVWTQHMNPASQRPKQTRTKEDTAARMAVRRHGGACPKHKATKKAVRFSGQNVGRLQSTDASISAVVGSQDIVPSHAELRRRLQPQYSPTVRQS